MKKLTILIFLLFFCITLFSQHNVLSTYSTDIFISANKSGFKKINVTAENHFSTDLIPFYGFSCGGSLKTNINRYFWFDTKYIFINEHFILENANKKHYLTSNSFGFSLGIIFSLKKISISTGESLYFWDNWKTYFSVTWNFYKKFSIFFIYYLDTENLISLNFSPNINVTHYTYYSNIYTNRLEIGIQFELFTTHIQPLRYKEIEFSKYKN